MKCLPKSKVIRLKDYVQFLRYHYPLNEGPLPYQYLYGLRRLKDNGIGIPEGIDVYIIEPRA